LRINGRPELKRALEEGRIDIARAVVLVEAPQAALSGLLGVAPTVSVAELRCRVAAEKARGRMDAESESRRQLRGVLQSLRTIKYSTQRDLLDSIRREVDRLSVPV
jgi:hypothetical protein